MLIPKPPQHAFRGLQSSNFLPFLLKMMTPIFHASIRGQSKVCSVPTYEGAILFPLLIHFDVSDVSAAAFRTEIYSKPRVLLWFLLCIQAIRAIKRSKVQLLASPQNYRLSPALPRMLRGIKIFVNGLQKRPVKGEGGREKKTSVNNKTSACERATFSTWIEKKEEAQIAPKHATSLFKERRQYSVFDVQTAKLKVVCRAVNLVTGISQQRGVCPEFYFFSFRSRRVVLSSVNKNGKEGEFPFFCCLCRKIAEKWQRKYPGKIPLNKEREKRKRKGQGLDLCKGHIDKEEEAGAITENWTRFISAFTLLAF